MAGNRTSKPTLPATGAGNGPGSGLSLGQMALFNDAATRLLYARTALLQNIIDPPNRDINKECGYPTEVTPEMCWEMYRREGVAKRIIEAYAKECWDGDPKVYETVKEEDRPPFEVRLDELVRKLNLWGYCERLDRLSGIGRFGLMLYGFNDIEKAEQLAEPVRGFNDRGERIPGRPFAGLDILYLRVFHEPGIDVEEVDQNPNSWRFSRPLRYKIRMADPRPGNPNHLNWTDRLVHWTRVHHFADNLDSSEIYGQMRLEPCYNRLVDIRKILGGSGEMFWKGGFPGISFEAMPGPDGIFPEYTEEDKKKLRQEFSDFQNSLQRFISLVGFQANSLNPTIADPSKHMAEQYRAISATTGIPTRILTGSEAAHLASTQDLVQWGGKKRGRQTKKLTPDMVRAIIDHWVMLGVLPSPRGGPKEYISEWPDMSTATDKDKADISFKKSSALQAYVTGKVWQVMGPIDYFVKIWDFSADVARDIWENAKKDNAELKKMFPEPIKGQAGRGLDNNSGGISSSRALPA